MQCVILQPCTIPLGPAGGNSRTNKSHLFTRCKHVHLLLNLPESRALCAFRKLWQVLSLFWEEAGRGKEDIFPFSEKTKGEVKTPLNISADNLMAIADWDPGIPAWYSLHKNTSLNKKLWQGKCHRTVVIRYLAVTFWFLVILQSWQSSPCMILYLMMFYPSSDVK